MEVVQIERDSVILVGAGLSRGVGLPLMNDLLKRTVPEDFIELVKCMGGFPHEHQFGIEDFITLLDFENKLHRGSKASNVDYLSGFSADIVNSTRAMESAPHFWETLAALIEACGTIVTLNWDTLIEIQIRALGQSVVYKGMRTSGKRVYKLHGSVDWYKTRDLGGFASQAEFADLFGAYSRYRPWSEEEGFLGVTGEIAELFNRVAPVISSPTFIKGVPAGPFRQIWQNAYSALEGTSQLVIIGYSLPQSDYLIRLMLQRAIRYQHLLGFDDAPEIVVINPDSSGAVRERYMEVFGSNVRYLQLNFADVSFASPV